MTPTNIHHAAMRALAQGIFSEAQRLLYLNCAKFPGYRSYNNLGLYLYENGMDLKNNTTRSAAKIGEHYIQRALNLEQNQTILNNLGRISYERGEYLRAYQYYSQSYELVRDDAIAYNIAVTLFCLHRYTEAHSILKDCKDKLQEARLPYLFSAMYANETEAKDFVEKFPEEVETLDEADQLLLFYLCKRYDKIICAAKNLLSDWWLREEQWAVLIDSFIRSGEEERLEKIIADYTDQENQRLCRKIRRFTQDDAARERMVAQCFDELVFPVIVLLGYCED